MAAACAMLAPIQLTGWFLCRLVGCATVPKTNSWPIDKFLMLPDETFAVMAAQFVFPSG